MGLAFIVRIIIIIITILQMTDMIMGVQIFMMSSHSISEFQQAVKLNNYYIYIYIYIYNLWDRQSACQEFENQRTW
jgi:hypothetical protein